MSGSPPQKSASDSGSHRLVQWKDLQELPRAAEQLESPYDLDARYRHKRSTNWMGYMVHYTETCDQQRVSLITHVHTTPATVHESQCTALIQAALAKRKLLPREQFVDAAYIDAELLVSSLQEYGITLVGPPRRNPSWHGKQAGAYTREQFQIDWERRQLRCPQGKWSSVWTEPREANPSSMISVHFRKPDCLSCATRALCTSSTIQPRHFNLLPRLQHEALQTARAAQATQDGQQRYAPRAGIEGTISQSVRSFGARRTRYRGLPKTHLQQVMTAVAINAHRLVAWFDKVPKATTRTSHFAALAA